MSAFNFDRFLAKKAFYQLKGFLWADSKSRFSFLCELCERFRVVDSQVGENFSIEVNTCHFKAVHQFAVRKSVDSCSRIDPCDPQFSEISLSSTSADERIVQRLHYRFSRDTVRLALVAEITLREFKNLSTLFQRVYTSFNTHMFFSLLP
jgi:hypothetical protein